MLQLSWGWLWVIYCAFISLQFVGEKGRGGGEGGRGGEDGSGKEEGNFYIAGKEGGSYSTIWKNCANCMYCMYKFKKRSLQIPLVA